MVSFPATVAFPSPTPATVGAAEPRWAADELAGLIRRVGPDTVAGMVLRQAHRELSSLVASAADAPAEVFGPFRVRAA